MEEKIQLADGKEYIISTLNVGDLIEIEKKFGTTQLDTTKTEAIIYWLYLALKKKNKDITSEEKLYQLIDLPFMMKKGMIDTIEAMMRVNEMDKVPKNSPSPAEAK